MADDDDQPDLFDDDGDDGDDDDDAKKARDEALERVAKNSAAWMVKARIALKRLPRGWIGIGEEIRLELRRMGLEKPHHHNVWGAFINDAIKDGFLEKTGVSRSMRTRRSHARKTDEYRRR